MCVGRSTCQGQCRAGLGAWRFRQVSPQRRTKRTKSAADARRRVRDSRSILLRAVGQPPLPAPGCGPVSQGLRLRPCAESRTTLGTRSTKAVNGGSERAMRTGLPRPTGSRQRARGGWNCPSFAKRTDRSPSAAAGHLEGNCRATGPDCRSRTKMSAGSRTGPALTAFWNTRQPPSKAGHTAGLLAPKRRFSRRAEKLFDVRIL